MDWKPALRLARLSFPSLWGAGAGEAQGMLGRARHTVNAFGSSLLPGESLQRERA